MLDAVTLDHLRTFIAAADEGSFSAAGRKLQRAQSVVSQVIATLEGQLGVPLFDRGSRYPRLTDQGCALLADARAVVGRMDAFKAHAKGLAGGLEPKLSVVIDVMYPMAGLTAAVAAFRDAFPSTALRLYVEALGGVVQLVLEGRCRFGVIGSLPMVPPAFARERLLGVRMATVVAPGHPLATYAGSVPTSALQQHVQLVLTDRTDLSQGREFGVISAQTWHLADLGAKHAFLRAGLGWGHMPMPTVEADLARGTLVEIILQDAPPGFGILPMFAVYHAADPPGPAGRWLIARLRATPGEAPYLSQTFESGGRSGDLEQIG
jgi:DNA-binding transcriptional LysR family regulator